MDHDLYGLLGVKSIMAGSMRDELWALAGLCKKKTYTLGGKMCYGGLYERRIMGIGGVVQKENLPTFYSYIYLLGDVEGEKC